MINLLYPQNLKPSSRARKKTRGWKYSHKLILMLGGLFFVINLLLIQQGVTGVYAAIIPSADPDHLHFGLVFPAERLSQNFRVFIESTAEPINYKLIEYPKPRPEYIDALGDAEAARLHCRANPEDLENCYPDLCKALSETITDAGETDTQYAASLDPQDLEDIWEVELTVPAIKDHVAQDHEGGIVEAEKEYGCDIAVRILEDTNGDDNGVGGDGDPGDPGDPGETIASVQAATPLQMILPATLPQAGAWALIITAALLAFGLIALIWKKR